MQAFTDILQQPSSTAARIPDPHSDQKVKEDHETPSYASDDCLRTVRDASTQYDLSHIVHPEERAHCLTSSPIRDAGNADISFASTQSDTITTGKRTKNVIFSSSVSELLAVCPTSNSVVDVSEYTQRSMMIVAN